MTDPTAPRPDFTSPIAGRIEVRDPCPWCSDRPMVPRSLMDEHVAQMHPEVQTVEPPSGRAALRDRIAEALDSLQVTAHHLPFETRQRVIEVVTGAVLPPPVPRADVLREAATVADEKAKRLPDEWGGHEWGQRVADGARAVAVELRRMADEAQPGTEAPATADCNTGPGWYEVISPRATTCIAYVHEDGSLYLPEGEALTREEFAFAAARGNAHRLVRADEMQQNGARTAPRPLLTLATPCAVCAHPYNWHKGGVCQADDETTRCGCIAFAQAEQQDGAGS